MLNTNTGGSADAAFWVEVAGNGAGDPFINWSIVGSNDWVMGMDNSTTGNLLVLNAASNPSSGNPEFIFDGANMGITGSEAAFRPAELLEIVDTTDVVLILRPVGEGVSDNSRLVFATTDLTTGGQALAATNIMAEINSILTTGTTIDADLIFSVNTGDTLTQMLQFDGSAVAGNLRTLFNADAIGASEMDDGTCDTVISVVLDPTFAGATDDFVSLNEIDVVTGEASFSATEDDENEFVVPIGMVANNHRVDIAVAPGAGNDDWQITLRDDIASTSLTCDIAETAITCGDASNQPAIVAGSRLAVLVDSDIGGGTDPTDATEMVISFCLTHD